MSLLREPREIYTGGMSSAPSAGGQEKLPDQTPGTSDPVLAAAVRVQRRRHRWALAIWWSVVGCVSCWVISSDANSNGTPPPPWFTGLTIAFGAGAGAALLAVAGYSVAMHRKPLRVQEQAIRLERQRIRSQGWQRRVLVLIFWAGLWLGIPLFSCAAVVLVIALANAVAYLAGAGQVIRWAAIPVTSGGDAAVAIIVGLLVIAAEALIAIWVGLRARRVWWPRYLQRRAGGQPVTSEAAAAGRHTGNAE
jgi:hypothetical protein